MGRHFVRGDSEYLFKVPTIPFCSIVECHPISAKDLSRLHQLGKKVLPGVFLGYASHAGGIWKGDTPVADTEELGQMDASETPRPKAQCKGSVNANER